MISVFTPQDVKNIDEACVIEAGMTVQELMENAAQSAADIIVSMYKDKRSILVLCGNGNNGGDGFAIARLLSEQHMITVAADPLPDKMSEATRTNFKHLPTSVPVISFEQAHASVNEFDVVVDAVFGVGFKGSLRESSTNWFSEIHVPFKIAVDIPSGLNARDGNADAFVFRADMTISMEGLKLGMLCGKGTEVCGEIRIASIKAPEEIVRKHTTAYVLQDDDIRIFLPNRELQTSKFDYGRVLVIAGSTTMRGAAALTSHAALRTGAGLVELVTSSVHPLTPREVIATEVMATKDGTISASAKDILQGKLRKATTVAIGPGIGDNSETLELLREIIEDTEDDVPIVIDADGLRIVNRLSAALSHSIITPHHGEYDHIVGRSDALKNTTCLDRIEHCTQLAKERGCVVHLKSYPSVTTNGTKVYLTRGGNPGMATAGSGDVLTGIIAGLCAQHVPMLEAAALGSYIHCRAGDEVTASIAPESMIAGDIITSIGKIIPL